MVKKLEPGRYTVTDISSGMALDFSGANDGTLHAWDLYSGSRQQVRTVALHFSLGAGGADRSSFSPVRRGHDRSPSHTRAALHCIKYT